MVKKKMEMEKYSINMDPQLMHRALRSTEPVDGGSAWIQLSEGGVASVHLRKTAYLVSMSVYTVGEVGGNYLGQTLQKISEKVGKQVSIVRDDVHSGV